MMPLNNGLTSCSTALGSVAESSKSMNGFTKMNFILWENFIISMLAHDETTNIYNLFGMDDIKISPLHKIAKELADLCIAKMPIHYKRLDNGIVVYWLVTTRTCNCIYNANTSNVDIPSLIGLKYSFLPRSENYFLHAWRNILVLYPAIIRVNLFISHTRVRTNGRPSFTNSIEIIHRNVSFILEHAVCDVIISSSSCCTATRVQSKWTDVHICKNIYFILKSIILLKTIRERRYRNFLTLERLDWNVSRVQRVLKVLRNADGRL